VNIDILYPLFGFIIFGNGLFIINTFLPIGSIYVVIFVVLLIIPAIVKIKLFIRSLNFKKLNKKFLLYYLAIPSLLVISTFDIAFNYDAGYYHLLHQNWLRNSNLIIGMVNIFWPFGMSSIYEYVSAFLWFDTSFVLLHFINLFFIHFFYLFLGQNIIESNNKYLANSSIFVLLFSLFDNFGLGGGRNGYIYIQGVTKQDVTVGILFFFLALVIFLKIKDSNITNQEIVIVSFLLFFIYQIKVSGVLIVYLYLILLINQILKKRHNFTELIKLNFPVLILAISWILKSVYTTGCLIYPVNITCIEVFDWYIDGSTESFEGITKQASLAFDGTLPFLEWMQIAGSFEYRNQVFSNFLISILILIFIKFTLFKKSEIKNSLKFVGLSFIFFSLLYLIYFGPIPRYAVGICIFSASFIGLLSSDRKHKISNNFAFVLLFISALFLVRSTAYSAFLNNNELKIFDPRTNYEINYEIGFEKLSEDWVAPLDADQCWANIKCTASKDIIEFGNAGIFKIAYK
tara:strand:+ start:5556 stop:7103 length:1548 start_codon:yes stop_codon:yes gene_type:complete